ncbi:hypothetical protein [Nitrosarchaeum koreense]|uniref:Uncharacterized protein n=1 Tax=Nitrosarchaeum koreense MY1 TaxID=1001994 RepID=F9CV08_9ARCH|nr:hypothetical protein [Nitrosarchaeum koreense]EGP94712.1 hypothetical protein MY1_1968 [Nitrosarchaeum koreense MY1]
MNRLKTIVLFAGIFGIGLGTISLSGVSATSMMVSAAPQTQAGFDMLGHVEYKVLDDSGAIKQYLQGDNIVVIGGKDCVARHVFENSTGTVCPGGNNEFQYIAIGNYTSAGTPVNTLSALELTGGSGCASSTVDGEMARKQVVPSFTPAVTGTGTIVVLDTTSAPFNFGASNATGPIMQSGIFNGDNAAKDGNGQCTSLGTASMFSVQDLNTDTGITVSSGDSLSVKWTITVG